MTFEEKINFLKNKWEANKMAIITDAKNNKFICAICHNETSKYFALSIELHNSLNLERVGFINIFRDPENRLLLSSIYVNWAFRGLRLATKLNDLATFVLKNESGKIIRGRFAPYDNLNDHQLPKDLSNEERIFYAEKFYLSNGYTIVKTKDFEKKPKNFPLLNIRDFNLSEENTTSIVYKILPALENYNFYEENNFITECEPEENLEK